MSQKLPRVRGFAPAAHGRRLASFWSAGWLSFALLVDAAASTTLPAYQAEDHAVVPRNRQVTIVCPKLVPTRVVLPERVTGYRGDPVAEAALGFQIQTRPQPVITVQPREHPVEARFRIEGATRALVLVFRTAESGEPRDVRLTFGSASAADRGVGHAAPRQRARVSPAAAEEPKPPGLAPTPVPTSSLITSLEGNAAQPAAAPVAPGEKPAEAASEGTTTPGPATSAAEMAAEPAGLPASQTPAASDSSAAPGTLLDAGILTARVRSVGRVERLPGQRPVELIDILEGSRHVWLRFSIGEARGARVDGISWEHGRITAYAVEQVDKGSRLALVVQLPRRSETGTSLITKRTRIHLKLDDGERRFPLSAPWLGSVVKDLFGW